MIRINLPVGAIVFWAVILSPFNPKVLFAAEEKKLVYHFDKRPWIEHAPVSNGSMIIVEYTRQGETVEQWKELVTAQVYPLGPKVKEVVEGMKTHLRRDCPSVVWQVISEKENDEMIEWSNTQCANLDFQHELMRTYISGKQLNVLRYTTKKIPISPKVREEWIGILSKK